MAVKLEASYQVGTGDVTLTVVIGNRQLGTSRARLDGSPLHTGDFDDFVVGPGPDLVGKQLSVKTIVSDVNDQTNITSVRYRLDGGLAPATWTLEAPVEEPGGSIVYRAIFDLE